MRRLLLVSALLAAAALFVTGRTAVADNGPHQGAFTPTTDACAGCHRAHRGRAEKLLKEASQTDLCFSCHGSSGTGADTNVEDGVYLERDSTPGEGEGTVNAGLRGGGFVNVVMDPDMDLTVESAPATSRHDVGQVGTIWGNGAISSGPGKSGVALECGSCHNPHGFSDQDRYRILRPVPRDSGATSGVNVDDENTKKYTAEYWSHQGLDGYRDIMDARYLEEGRDVAIAEWCSQCHTRYLADDFTDSGDDIFQYRHVTHVADQKGVYLTCLACHVAHGTSVIMETYSGDVEWPNGDAGGGANDSRLLHVNNRGVCVQCHEVPGVATEGCLRCHQTVP